MRFSLRQTGLALVTAAVTAALLGVAGSGAAVAGDKVAGKVGPNYTLPKDAKKCVRPTDFMRRNHMKLLFHKRDGTVHLGKRAKTESLQNCINCHVTRDEAGKALKVSDPKHFCAACHTYVSVKLDCFECHRSTPDETKSSAALPNIPAHKNLLARNTKAGDNLTNYLKGVTK